jgi:single-strand DNA-binding protein
MAEGGEMNQFIITGRLTKDPEVKYTSTQTAMANIVVAVDEYVKGEKKTNFPRISVYGSEAENLALYSGKGLKIAVMGKIRTGQYEKDGKTIYTTDLIADHIEYLEYKPKDVPDFNKIDGDIPF